MKPQIDIGLTESTRTEIAQGLARVLADTAALTVLARNFHWNVTGPLFQTLHGLFDAEYTALAMAQDVVAERIRALGLFAPASFGAFAALTSIEEVKGPIPATEMVRRLVDGHARTAQTAREVIEMAEAAKDVVTADLLTTRIAEHDKTAWMLRSMLEG